MRHAPLPFALALALAACGPAQQPPPPATQASLATTQAGGLGFELRSDTAGLGVGLTPVYVKVTRADTGAAVAGADVEVKPMMTMADGHQHGAPVISPKAAEVEAGLYRTELVFTMAGGAGAGSWSLAVGATPAGEAKVAANFDAVAVSETQRVRSFSVTDPAMPAMPMKFFVSFNLAAAPKVGLNPVTVTVHQMKDMMTFEPVTDAVLGVTPEMPSMGHGSSGSEAPMHTAAGCYGGKVSFSMAGDWRTTVDVRRAGELLGTVAFDTSF